MINFWAFPWLFYFKKPQGDPLLVQAVNTSVRMEDVFHSCTFAMETSSVSMVQMSLLAVEVSIKKQQ